MYPECESKALQLCQPIPCESYISVSVSLFRIRKLIFQRNCKWLPAFKGVPFNNNASQPLGLLVLASHLRRLCCTDFPALKPPVLRPHRVLACSISGGNLHEFTINCSRSVTFTYLYAYIPLIILERLTSSHTVVLLNVYQIYLNEFEL
jgi:hypothetical protein